MTPSRLIGTVLLGSTLCISVFHSDWILDTESLFLSTENQFLDAPSSVRVKSDDKAGIIVDILVVVFQSIPSLPCHNAFNDQNWKWHPQPSHNRRL